MKLTRSVLSPSMLAGCGMVFVFAFAALSNLAQYLGLVNPHVQIELGGDDEHDFTAHSSAQKYYPVPPAIDGEVTRTTERVREVSALMMGLVLYTTNDQIRGRTPPDVDRLLNGAKGVGLLPPGILITSSGTLAASHPTAAGKREPHGTLFVRYRPRPVTVEVISLGRDRRDGPALMMRVPIDEAEGKDVPYFTSISLDRITIPRPFSNQAELLGAGWKKESLRAAEMLPEERNEMWSWSQKRAALTNNTTALNP